MSLADLFAEQRLQVFLLALARLSAAFAIVPAISEHVIPTRVKAGFAGLFALLMVPLAAPSFTPLHGDELLARGVAEMGVGFFIGLILTCMFEALAIACRVIETQAGLSLGSSVLALAGGGASSLGALYHSAALAIFMSCGAWTQMLRGLASTFKTLPVGEAAHIGLSPTLLTHAGTAMMFNALHFGAPVVGGILLTDVGLGLLSRAASQLNIFSVGFSLKIAVALMLALASFAAFSAQFARALHETAAALFGVHW